MFLVPAIGAALYLSGGAPPSQPQGGGAINPVSSVQTEASKGPLAQSGVRLGMSLDDWRSLGSHLWPDTPTAPLCVSEKGSQFNAQDRLTPAPEVLKCTYGSRYGMTVFRPSLPLFQPFRAQEPKFEFVNGRLSRIEFETSVDGFSSLDTWLTDHFGPPVQTVRDKVRFAHGLTYARVRRNWRKGGLNVWLIDPSRQPDLLTVRYGAPAPAPPPSQG